MNYKITISCSDQHNITIKGQKPTITIVINAISSNLFRVGPEVVDKVWVIDVNASVNGANPNVSVPCETLSPNLRHFGLLQIPLL